MPNLKIELIDVTCRDTEDITGADDFYLMGALAGGAVTKAILTRPIKINNRQTKTFRPEDTVLFEGEIPEGQSVKGGLKAYDEDAAKDWTKYGDTIKKITSAVSAAVSAAGGPHGAIAGTILSAAVTGSGWLATLDKDYLLGTTELEISATGPSMEERSWVMSKKGGSGWSTWDYTLRYRITRS
ncbi:hypothetical protein C7B69_09445 [filamentous cyanobacterium Phorm 46]|nr:hypothetical protein C7B69_09445 [filamentous cyanobacterium Phorm 46]